MSAHEIVAVLAPACVGPRSYATVDGVRVIDIVRPFWNRRSAVPMWEICRTGGDAVMFREQYLNVAEARVRNWLARELPCGEATEISASSPADPAQPELF